VARAAGIKGETVRNWKRFLKSINFLKRLAQTHASKVFEALFSKSAGERRRHKRGKLILCSAAKDIPRK